MSISTMREDGLLKFQKGKFQESAKIFQSIVDNNDGTPHDYLSLCEALLAEAKITTEDPIAIYDKAAAVYENLCSSSPLSGSIAQSYRIQIIYNKAKVYDARGNIEDAINEYHRAEYVLLSNVMGDLSGITLRSRSVTVSRSIAPKRVFENPMMKICCQSKENLNTLLEVLIRQGEIAQERGNKEEALRCFKLGCEIRYIDLHSYHLNTPEIKFNIGVCLANLGSDGFYRAIEQFEGARDDSGDNYPQASLKFAETILSYTWHILDRINTNDKLYMLRDAEKAAKSVLALYNARAHDPDSELGQKFAMQINAAHLALNIDDYIKKAKLLVADILVAQMQFCYDDGNYDLVLSRCTEAELIFKEQLSSLEGKIDPALYCNYGEFLYIQGSALLKQEGGESAAATKFREAKDFLLKAIFHSPNRKFAEAYAILSDVFGSLGDEINRDLASSESEKQTLDDVPNKLWGDFLVLMFSPEDLNHMYMEKLQKLDFSYQHIDSLQVENIGALVDILMQLKNSHSFNIKILEDCSFGKISVIGFYLNAIKFYEIDIEKVILPLSSEVVSIFLCNLGGSLENKSASAMIQKVMQEATSPEALVKTVIDICTLLTKVPSIIITKFTPEERQKLLDSIANLEKTYLTEAQIKTLDSTTRVRELEEVAKVFSIYKIPFERVLACQGDQLKRLHASVEVLGNYYRLSSKDFEKLTNDQINAIAGEDGENAFLFMTYGLAPRKFVPNDEESEALHSEDIRLLLKNIKILKTQGVISEGQYQDLGFAHVKNLPSSTTVIADNIDLFRENDIDTKTLITYSAAEIASIVRSIKAIIGLKDLPSRCSMEQLIAIDGKLVPLDRKLGLTYEDIVEFTAHQIHILVSSLEDIMAAEVFKTLKFRAKHFQKATPEEFKAAIKDIFVVNKTSYKPQGESNPILELPLAVISTLANKAKHLLKEDQFPLKEFKGLTSDVIECLAKHAKVLFEQGKKFTPQNYAGLDLDQIEVLVGNYNNFFKKQKLKPADFKAINAEKMTAIAKYSEQLLNAERPPAAFAELSVEQIDVIGENAKIILDDCGFAASKFAIFTPNQIKWLVNDLMILVEYTSKPHELSLLSFEQIRALSMNAEVLFGMAQERAEFKPNTFRETPAHRITEIAREKYISSQKAVAETPKYWQLGEEVYSTEITNPDAPFIYSLDPEQKLYGMIHPSLLEQLNKDGGGIRGQVENALAKGLKFNGKYVIGVIKQGGIYKVKTDTDLRVYTTKQYENEEGKMLLIFDRSGSHSKISAKSRDHEEVTTIKAEVTFKYEAPSAEEADSDLSGASDDDADF